MRQYLINKNSDNLILFFSGWGCDEFEFKHLGSKSDVLILYDYTDLNLDFDFSNYNKIDLLSFSAGVFVASIFQADFNINKKIALDGNPYLFDEKYGLSADIQNLLCSITEENADYFAKNYLVKTEEEYKNFHPSNRTIESCQNEFNCLKQIYKQNKHKIKDIFDVAIMGDEDKIFDLSIQKEFYGKRLRILKNARHNSFFRIKNFEEIFNINS